jgi:SAM-dependent methyltransferase
VHPRALFGAPPDRDANGRLRYRISEDQDLVPPPLLMLEEADEVLEDWFAGGAEQSTLLRALVPVGDETSVLELGCGLGRLAFALRRVLRRGSYLGIDIVPEKIAFLRREFSPRYPRFRFEVIEAVNAFYRSGTSPAGGPFPFPCDDSSVDVVVAMAVFTHVLPDTVFHYLTEVARCLRPNGSFLVSAYLLENYRPGQPRPARYSERLFDFDVVLADECTAFRTSDATCPEAMLAMEAAWLIDTAAQAGLELVRPPLMGSWSGTAATWMTGQDLVLLRKPSDDGPHVGGRSR